MTISKSWFSYLTRAFALSLCTALLLSFVSCSDSSTSQDPKVKIILDANGGSFSETIGKTETTKTLLIKKNQASKLSTADELGRSRENHNFTGWAKSQQGTVEYDDGADITSSTDLTLYAQWEAVNSTYTVKHLLQNLQDDEYTEDEEAAEQKTGTYGTQTAAVAKTYEGFTAQTFEQATIQADGSTVVEIYYDRNTYTLSYSSEYGDEPKAKTVKYGYVLTAEDLPDLTQTNYSFNGWVYENTSIEAGYTVTGAITLTALWDEIIASYTVKHLLQNLADDSYTEDEEAAEPKSGKSGTKTSAAAKTYEGFTAKTFEQATIQADGSTVVEIHYDRNTYTLSYSSEYGDAPSSKPVKYGYVLTAADLPDLTQTNYSFKGWVFDGASIAAGYTVKKAITLTAQWDEIIATYTVKHLRQNLQNDSYTEDSTEQKSGKSGTKTSAAAKTYEGFTAKSFTQATIQADGTTVIEIYYDRKTYTISYSSTYGEPPVSKPVKYEYVLTAADFRERAQTGKSVKGGGRRSAPNKAGYTVKKAITLTAQWDEIIASYTVKHLLQNLQNDGYTEKATEQKSGKSGTKTSAAAKTYEGFTAKSFTQATIQADGSTVVEIHYDRNTYTISYSSEYGDAPTSKTVKYGYILTAADLPDLTQTNYSFNGWLLAGVSITAGYTVKTDITLAALWDEIIATYTVKHLLQNLQDDNYTEKAAEPKSGKSGTKTSAAAKSYEGFTAKSFTQATIQADGSTVIEIYYDRNTYTLSYSSTYGEPPASKPVKYGYVLTAADLPVLTQKYYSFKGWLLDGASITAGYTVKKDITLTAQWEVAASTYFVTKENISEVIAELTEDSTIVLTGELSDSDLTAIATAIKNSTYKVNLDLSQTTELTSIPDSTFRDCSKLSGITIPDSVTSIGNNAFYRCRSLSSVTIPDSVTSINLGTFYGCSALSLVTIPDSVTYIGNEAFYCCISLSSVTIPDSVTIIGYYAFEGCSKLSSVTIPDSVTAIGISAFLHCPRLESINVDSNNAKYFSIDGVLFNKNATALITYPAAKQSAAYTIPDSVTSIKGNAFYGCTSLSSVTIGDYVTTIGDYAFENCSSLSSVTIPDSVTSIGSIAFRGCSKLTSISFIDPTTWYRTTSSTNWNKKTGGTLTDVSDAATNATYFKNTYKNYYWYKL